MLMWFGDHGWHGNKALGLLAADNAKEYWPVVYLVQLKPRIVLMIMILTAGEFGPAGISFSRWVASRLICAKIYFLAGFGEYYNNDLNMLTRTKLRSGLNSSFELADSSGRLMVPSMVIETQYARQGTCLKGLMSGLLLEDQKPDTVYYKKVLTSI